MLNFVHTKLYRHKKTGNLETEVLELRESTALLAKQLQDAYKLLDDHGVPIPGRTTQSHDARTFKWKVTHFADKVSEYAKDRAVTSPEFSLWGMKGLQVEWYPNGLEGGSFPGWSAVKLRLPTLQAKCKVSVKWRIVLGKNLWVGPRTDEFSDSFWWCKKGTINWPNFVKTELLKQQVDPESGAVHFTIDIIKATITPVDERGVSLGLGGPKRMPQVLSTQATSTLHSIALGGGSNSITAKHEGSLSGDYDVQLIINGEPFDDPNLVNLIIRYVKQTHIAIDNNSMGVSSRNLESPRNSAVSNASSSLMLEGMRGESRQSPPCTLRPRGVGNAAGLGSAGVGLPGGPAGMTLPLFGNPGGSPTRGSPSRLGTAGSPNARAQTAGYSPSGKGISSSGGIRPGTGNSPANKKFHGKLNPLE